MTYAIFLCLASTLVHSPALLAGVVLPDFTPVNIEPGDRLEQAIDINRNSGLRVEIKLISPPPGAQIAVNDRGQMSLQWETSQELPAQIRLVFQASDVDSQAVIETQELHVLRAVSPAEQSTISLNPMSNQIISGGQTVSIPMIATSSDSMNPVISIDRVPRNARFEKNPLGGYTFYWQTSDNDQGEHIFRITARHPSQNETFSTALLTVFIGDPSIRKTIPVENNQ